MEHLAAKVALPGFFQNTSTNITVIVILAIIAIAGTWYVIRLRQQARLREEVRNILFEYYPLQEYDLGEQGPNRSHSVGLMQNAL